MLATVRQAILIPASFSPSRLPGKVLLLDKFSPYTRAAGQAAQFNVAALRYLSHAGNAQLRGAVAGWWRSVWVYTDSKLADQVVATCSTIADNVGWDLRQLTASGKYQLTVGNGAAEKTALSSATPANAGWHQIYIEYDGTNIGISVDDEAIVQTALAAAYSPGANGFNVGATLTPSLYFDGRMQCLMGGDGVLTTVQRTANSVTPLAYDQIGGVISQTPTFFMWELERPSGAHVDLGYIANSLTNNNSVGTAAGTVLNAVSQWNDQSGNGNHAAQATQAAKPVLRRPLVYKFDGVNDYLATGSNIGISGAASRTIAFWAKSDKTDYTVEGYGVDTGASVGNAHFGIRAKLSPATWVHTDGSSLRDTLVAVSMTKWQHIVMTFNSAGTKLNIYIDGMLTAVKDVTVATLNTTNSPLVIARAVDASSEFFSGSIAEVIVLSQCLTYAQVQQLYRSQLRLRE